MSALEEIVTSVFGDLVDLETVAKMGPDPSGVHVPGQLRGVRRRRPVAKRVVVTTTEAQRRQQEKLRRAETERKIAQVSNAVGLAAGTAGTYTAARNYKDVRGGASGGSITQAVTRRYKLKPKTAARLGVLGAGSALALQSGNVAGDVITARVLGRKDVDKAYKPLHAVKAGRLRSVLSTLGRGGKHAPGAPPKGAHRAGGPYRPPMATPESSAVGKPLPAAPSPMGIGDFARSTQGKATLGVAGAYGIHQAGKEKGREQAYYGKADVGEVEIAGTFSKFDVDKQRAYGWASVVSLDGEPVIDRQGDYIGLEDIEEAAYTYVRKSRVAGDMHRRTHDDQPHKAGELIESVVFTPDKCHAMGLPASFSGKWWMGVQVEDPTVWAEVKKGNRTGFSIHGKGLRKDTTLDEIRSS